eukprot:GHVP01026502.1.p2 GENE.GHVP01026502.1~~GHVP01026502.1.p2  ORF type:complete len:152 (+),score=34.19 GHVP01026502.1:97-552(+)
MVGCLITAAGIAAASASTSVAVSYGAATAAVTGSEALAVAASGSGAALAASGTSAVLITAATAGIGAIVLGLEYKSVVATWDCWKPVLRNYSGNPSRGILLEELLEDSRIQNWNFQDSRIHVVNIWDEVFEITAVGFIEGVQAAHATQIMI